MKRLVVWCLIAWGWTAPAWGGPRAERPDRIHFAGLYLYRLGVDEAQWQRMLKAPEITYICSQFACNHISDRERRRVREASRAGKRVVAQLWYGGWGDQTWSYYSLAHIAMDPKIRQDFFDRILDPTIEALGPENLYAAHLLEETGMQFGVDIDEAGDPEDLWDGNDNGSNWDQPSWLGRGGVRGYIGGPYVVNIRRYNEPFRHDTGLDMRRCPVWNGAAWQAYRRWVSMNLEAGAHVAFAKHLHKKYPKVKAFAWDSIATDGCGATNIEAMREHLDGIIMDPYSNSHGIYNSVRAPRMVAPHLEIVAILWGVNDKPKGEMLNRAVSAYLGGADVIGFFGDKTAYTSDASAKRRIDMFRPFTKLRPFEHQPKVLLVTGRTQDFGGSPAMMTHLACYDITTHNEGHLVDLKRYELVILYEAWHRDIEPYVKGGGLVLIVSPYRDLKFIEKERYLVRPRRRDTAWGRKDIEYRPSAWWREHMHLQAHYPLTLAYRVAWKAGRKDVQQDLAFVFDVGKGTVCYAPLVTTWPYPPKPRLSALRWLLSDLARGLLLRAGRDGTARTCLADRAMGGGYLRMPSRDAQTTGYALFRQGDVRFQPTRLSGVDLVRGVRDPVLGPACSSAILRKK